MPSGDRRVPLSITQRRAIAQDPGSFLWSRDRRERDLARLIKSLSYDYYLHAGPSHARFGSKWTKGRTDRVPGRPKNPESSVTPWSLDVEPPEQGRAPARVESTRSAWGPDLRRASDASDLVIEDTHMPMHDMEGPGSVDYIIAPGVGSDQDGWGLDLAIHPLETAGPSQTLDASMDLSPVLKPSYGEESCSTYLLSKSSAAPQSLGPSATRISSSELREICAPTRHPLPFAGTPPSRPPPNPSDTASGARGGLKVSASLLFGFQFAVTVAAHDHRA
ncbi:hypothetical protein IAU60_006892 [Kwoniella sp. DSM 27419]